MKRLDTEDASMIHLKALVYGNTGGGKTTLGVTCPDPLIVLSEGQGYLAIKSAADRMGVPMPQVVLVETADDLRSVMVGLAGSRDEPLRIVDRETGDTQEYRWPQSVVLDSMTDIVEGLYMKELVKILPKDEHGEPEDSRKMYGILGKRIDAVLRFFRDLPMHVLFLCQANDEMIGEDNNKKRHVKPQLPGKLSKKICQSVNMVGYIFRKYTGVGDDDQREIGYTVWTTGPDWMELKACRPLVDHEVPDFRDWVMRLMSVPDTQQDPDADEGDSSDDDPGDDTDLPETRYDQAAG